MTILIRHKTSAHPASISAQTTCLLNHDLILHSVSVRISLVQVMSIFDLCASLNTAQDRQLTGSFTTYFQKPEA